ncbi:MAG: hypothetical protein SFU85_04065 [Candidatus Methylacidiphilales bacterium]|nr:hypothetical protein [Candidatus Methylacidiphilales bacterium]
MKPPHIRATFPSMPRFFLILPLLLALAAGCGSHSSSPELIILQTGRIFGNVYPLDTKSIAPLQHYPYLAGYVKKIRQEAAASGAQVLLIDSGDSLGGSFASHATHGANMVRFFNQLGYDAVLLGNLDASVDPAILAQLRMPVLVPFQKEDGTSPLPNTSAALSLPKGPLTVRLMANFYGDTASSEFPHRFPVWFGAVPRGIQPVRDYEAFLNAPLPAGSIPVTLFHWMKFEPSAIPPSFVEKLKTDGVDAILAHRIYNSGVRDTWERQTLDQWPVPVSENILRQNGGFTIARLDLARKGGKWAPVAPSTLVQMNANTAPADPDIIREINLLAPTIKSADETLATLDKTLLEDQILPAYMKMLAARFKADTVLFSTGAIRSELPSGPLTANRLYASLPWNNPLVFVRLDATQAAQAATMSGHAVLRKSGAGAPTRLLTSLFFARLLQDQFHLPDQALEIIPGSNEFENAKAMVKASPSSLADASIPEGWSYATAP